MKIIIALIPLWIVVAMVLTHSAEGDEVVENQLVLVDNNEVDDQEGTVEQYEEPLAPALKAKPIDMSKVFIPTEEWQEVREDHIVLPGLHVQMNIQTGKKLAKLMDGDDGSKYMAAVERIQKTGHTGTFKATVPLSKQRRPDKLEGGKKEEAGEGFRHDILEALENKLIGADSEVELKQAEMYEALKLIKSEDGKTPKELSEEAKLIADKYRTYDELKEELKKINLNLETDMEVMTRLFEQYSNAGTDEDQRRQNILEDLEYMVHQFDNAVNFISMGGLKVIILPGLNATNPSIRKGVLHLLGSAAQSNPKVQIAALEAGLIPQLLRIVAFDPEFNVENKALYAVSCIVRGFPLGQQVLVQNGGLQVFRKLFDDQDFKRLNIQMKVVSLLHDLLAERVEARGERQKQLSNVELQEALVNGGWCQAVSSLLTVASFDNRDRRYDMGAALRNRLPLRPDHDTVDKVISAMEMMSLSCQQDFKESLPLLRNLVEKYDDLAFKEKFQDDNEEGNGLFKGMAEQLQRLVTSISSKDEL